VSKKEIQFGRHLILKESQKADVNGKCSAESLKSALVPLVMKMRIDRGIGEQETMASMHDRPGHTTGDVMNFAATASLRVVSVALRIVQILQPPDQPLFVIFKQRQSIPCVTGT
jgi:hypothetical protein